MHGDRSPRNPGQLNVTAIAVLGAVSVLLLVEIVVVAQAYYYNLQEREIAAKQVAPPVWELADLRAAQQAELNSFRWADRERLRAALPIDLAVREYVRQEAGRPDGPRREPAIEQAKTRPEGM